MKTTFLRVWGVVLLFALAACSSAGGGTTTPATLETIRMTVFPGAIPSQGIYIADGMGFFAEEGLKVEYINVGTGSSAQQVLLAGETDFTISDITALASIRAAGGDVVYVSGQFHRFMATLACQPEFELPSGGYPATMAAMEGATIGITAPGSATDTYFQFSVIDAGLDPQDSEIVPIGGVPQLLAAFEAKSVDCLVAYQPMQQIMDVSNSAVNWEAGEGPDEFDTYLFNGVITTQAYDDANADKVKKVANAMKKAVEFARDPNNAAEIAEATIQFYDGLEQSVLEQIVRDGAGTYGWEITAAHVENAAVVYEAITGNPLNVEFEGLMAASLR